MKYQTVYFEKPGPENTNDTLKLVQEWANMLNIQHIVIATTTGKTGIQALKLLKSHHVIIVTHSTGFAQENEQELSPEFKDQIESMGSTILTCPHAFGGIGRAVRLKYKTYELDDIVASTLRLLGQGSKVAVEIALMAADSGLIQTDKDIIAVGGTNHGADTALVIKPSNVGRFFDLRIRGFLCKPWDF
ncbi:hypothetical protein JW824_09245 [bacterium]|nr:hypothetical protein [bacterium]RQV94277.1 MAG: hypothetical protein EH221_07450 [bacterium]